MIWYNASDLELDTSWLHNATLRCPSTWGSAGAPHRDHLRTRYEPRTGRNRRTGPAAGNDVCNIAVIADYKWYQQHGNNYATAAQAMLVSIEYANTRLREARFGDRSYGVAVQRLFVLSSPAVDPFYRINSQWGAMVRSPYICSSKALFFVSLVFNLNCNICSRHPYSQLFACLPGLAKPFG